MRTNYYLTLTAVIVAGLVSCTSEDLINEISPTVKTDGQAVMSFDVHTQNQTRAEAGALQKTYKDFGVWAYKNTGNTTEKVMDNFLVGYYDADGKTGYYGNSATTIGDKESSTDGQSMWFYEGLGSDEYDHSNETGDGYEGKSKSANATQNLKYWDYSSTSTDFFAYAPYGDGKLYSYDNKEISTNDYVWAGFSNQDYQEKLLAYKNVTSASYGKDVQLQFKRINAAVQLAFYAPIPGFWVTVNSVVVESAHQDTNGAIVTDSDDDKVAYGSKVKMTKGEDGKGEITVIKSDRYHITAVNDVQANSTANTFGAVTGVADVNSATHTSLTKALGLDKTKLSYADNTFYAMPASTVDSEKNSGFKVTVAFTMYSQSSNETIQMAGDVFIPSTYTQWKSNYKYVYVFKLTNDNPIVFDGVTVSDYDVETTGDEYTVYPTVINTSFPSELTVSTSTDAGPTGAEEEGNGYKNFEFSVSLKQLPLEWVKAVIDVSGSTDNTGSTENIIQSLQYYETDQNKTIGWKNLTATDKKYTFTGTDNGFPLQNNVPLKLRIRVNQTGTVKANIKIVGFTSGTVYGETTVSATAKDASAS